MHKEEIRKVYKEKRKAMSFEEIDGASVAIRSLVSKHFLGKGLTISLFFPIDNNNEIQTQGIYEDFQENNSRITGSIADFDQRTLQHLQVTDYKSLKANNYGIPEPIEGQRVHPHEFDIVFVPLFACDEHGYRVGYGKGFYDRFLSECNEDCLFVGLNFFDPDQPILDKENTDIPLDRLVTPEKVHYFE